LGLTWRSDNAIVQNMDQNPFLPAIDALKSKIAAKEDEIAPLRQQLAAKDAEINPLRETVNRLCVEAGLPLAFVIPDASEPATGTTKLRFRPDQFFNKELSEAAVEYLTAKKAADASSNPTPATADEIYTALTNHGYSFGGSSEASNKIGLKTALTRNTTQIAKISDELYGLRVWYGLRAKYKPRSPTANGGEAAETDAKSGKSETTSGAEQTVSGK
jgi:hypothetical protein